MLNVTEPEKLTFKLQSSFTGLETLKIHPVFHIQVTSERHCRARREALHASHSYLCLLASTRHHITLHKLFHGKGERGPEQVARLVGLQLPTQPGGKGWEK